MACYVYDELMSTAHIPQGHHVERPERVECIYEVVSKMGLTRLPSRLVTIDEIHRAHGKKYLTKMGKHGSLANSDMYWTHSSYLSVLLSAGCTCQMVNHILDHPECSRGFAIVRPPGHHASYNKESGFCWLNNIMIGAMSALSRPNVNRVLIVDWDVHYHLGTADILAKVSDKKEKPDDITVFSMHRFDNGEFFPGAGSGRTSVRHNGRVVNQGFNGPYGDKEVITALQGFLEDYETVGTRLGHGPPDLILVSCGFDAAEGDLLGGCHVTPAAYAVMTKMLVDVCPRVGMVLEGGYSLPVLQECSRAVCDVLRLNV